MHRFHRVPRRTGRPVSVTLPLVPRRDPRARQCLKRYRPEVRNGLAAVYNATISIFASGLYEVTNLVVAFSQEKPPFATLACAEQN